MREIFRRQHKRRQLSGALRVPALLPYYLVTISRLDVLSAGARQAPTKTNPSAKMWEKITALVDA